MSENPGRFAFLLMSSAYPQVDSSLQTCHQLYKWGRGRPRVPLLKLGWLLFWPSQMTFFKKLFQNNHESWRNSQECQDSNVCIGEGGASHFLKWMEPQKSIVPSYMENRIIWKSFNRLWSTAGRKQGVPKETGVSHQHSPLLLQIIGSLHLCTCLLYTSPSPRD